MHTNNSKNANMTTPETMNPHHHHHHHPHHSSSRHHHHQRSYFEDSPRHNPSHYSEGESGYFHRNNNFEYSTRFHHHHAFRSPSEPQQQSLIMEEPPISPHENDVLMGRGGKNNQHSGNEKLRKLARTRCAKYRVSSKKGKSAISRELVQRMRDLQPAARFLKRDSDTGGWSDVGDDIAREKASQVLRDAVALLQDGTIDGEEEEPSENSNDESVEPIALDAADRKPSDNKPRPSSAGPRASPTASVNTAASFPPPTNLENARKRHRPYFSEDDPLFFQAGEELMNSSPPQRRRSSESGVEYGSRSSSFHPHTGVHSASASPHHYRQHDSQQQQQSEHSLYHRRHHSSGENTAPAPTYSSTSDERVHPTMSRSPVPEYSSSVHMPSAHAPVSHHPQHPGAFPNEHRKQGRPQALSAAARQASAASCGSLLGEIGTGLTDFDLFNGELVFDDVVAAASGAAGEGDVAQPVLSASGSPTGSNSSPR